MSAFLDALAGATYSGDEDLSEVTPSAPGGAGYGGSSGFFQSLTALGTGYLSKRLDVDVQRRVQGAQPAPSQAGTGPYVSYRGGGVNEPAGSMSISGLNLAGILPWVLLGVAAFVVLRR